MRTPEEQVRYAASITPSPRQLAWQQLEFYAFTHFGMNTFTNREWGDGTEDPALFNPDALDADQWVAAVKSAGMKALILTCKHHDGFCLFDSRYTDFKSTNTPFGRDAVREFVDAFRAEGLAIGDYFDGIIASFQEHVCKPDTRIFEVLADRYGLDPARVLYLDDAPANVQAARSVGLQAVRVTPEHDMLAIIEEALNDRVAE